MDINKLELVEKIKVNQNRQDEINNLLLSIPKGHINILYRNNKGYYYLTYRNGKKINNDYLGPVGKTDLSEIMRNLTLRENLKKELRYLKNEEKYFKKQIGRRKIVQE